MRFVATVAFAAMLSAPAMCGDTVITKTKHTDGAKLAGVEQAAKDTTEVTWFAKDRMRIEEGDSVTIVRADQKKLFLLDKKAKTVSTIELPFDLKKYMPGEQGTVVVNFMAQLKATVTATTETKKVKDWNATKYTLTMTMPMGGGIAQEIWATKDIALDSAAFNDMYGALMATQISGAAIGSELKKVEGLPVLIESTQTMMGQNVKSREEVTAVETKDAPEGTYDVPKDFTEKPFDLMAMNPQVGGARARGAKPSAPPPPDKPKGGNPLAPRQD